VDVYVYASRCMLSPEAPVNDSDNYNRSKVEGISLIMKIRVCCLSKIWLYAGKSVDKILQYSAILWYNASIEI